MTILPLARRGAGATRGHLAAVALLLSALVSSAHAQGTPSLTDSLTWDPAVRRGVLPNGIHFFIKTNHKPEDRVSLRLAVPVGSTAEADDQQGLAHFTEHMNFNGSAHFKDADDLVGYLRSIGLRFGADANAYTSFDRPCTCWTCRPTRTRCWSPACTRSPTSPAAPR